MKKLQVAVVIFLCSTILRLKMILCLHIFFFHLLSFCSSPSFRTFKIEDCNAEEKKVSIHAKTCLPLSLVFICLYAPLFLTLKKRKNRECMYTHFLKAQINKIVAMIAAAMLYPPET